MDKARNASGLLEFFPFLKWLPGYSKRDFAGDMIAGLTIAIMLVPQGMAYALLAGLPPYVGLYTGILPVMVYGLFGSTRVLTFGPTAITSVLVLGTLSHLADQDSASYLTLSVSLTLLTGMVLVLMGLLRMGFIVNFLSQPVVIGYINAAAVIILFSQARHLLGIDVPRTSKAYELLIQPFQHLSEVNFTTISLSVGGMGIIYFFSTWLEHWLEHISIRRILRFAIVRSSALAVVAASTFVVYVFNLSEKAHVLTIGDIPAGFPGLSFGPFDFSHFSTLIIGAFSIAFVGLMEDISTAKSLASKRRQRINANQELIAMGLANLTAAVSGGYTGTTSISRSAVNYTAGARTGFSSVIAGAMMLVVVLFFTPLFYHLPNAALAAIIMMAVMRLIDLRAIRELWRYNRTEILPLLLTFFTVMVVGIEVGILAGVVIALVLYLWQSSRPRIVELGRVGYTQFYREIDRYETLHIPKVEIIRIDESLFFANAQYLDRQLRNYIADHPEIAYLILTCSGINDVDASALGLLRELIHEFDAIGIEVYLAELKEFVLDKMRRVHFIQAVGESRFFETTHAAVIATNQLIDDDELPV